MKCVPFPLSVCPGLWRLSVLGASPQPPEGSLTLSLCQSCQLSCHLPPGPCHPECGDQGCDGPSADQCLNCIHYSLGSVKTGR